MSAERLGNDPLDAPRGNLAEVIDRRDRERERAPRLALYRGAGERRARRVRALVRQIEQYERAIRGALESMDEIVRQLAREAERLDVDEDPDGGLPSGD